MWRIIFSISANSGICTAVCFLFSCFLGSSPKAYGQQIKFIKNLENQNICNENYDFKTNTISFEASKDSLNTCALWFNFGVTGYRLDTVLTFKSRFSRYNYNPSLPVYSYDNKNFTAIANKFHNNDFEISILPKSDTIYLATGFPYTFSMLKTFLDDNSKKKNLRKIEYLDSQAQLLTITGKNLKKDSKKKLIWIICRQHAFESVANYVLQGMLEYLLDDKKCDKKLLKNYIFKIVPMVDIENVTLGQTGRMSKPQDYNRDWLTKKRQRVQTIEDKILETSKQYNYYVFFDIHGTFPGGVTEYFSLFDLKGNESKNLEKYSSKISQNLGLNFHIIPDKEQSYEGLTADWWNYLNFKNLQFSTTIEIDWIENLNTYYQIGEEMIKAIMK